MNASWAEPPGRRILAFRFRCISVNERQLRRVAREAHSGVPFPLHLGKRTPVARVAHPCRSGSDAAIRVAAVAATRRPRKDFLLRAGDRNPYTLPRMTVNSARSDS